MTAKKLDSIDKDVEKLREECDEKLKSRNRFDMRVNVTIFALYLVFIVVAIARGDLVNALTVLVYSIWLAIVWMKEAENNNLRFIIDMQDGLRKMESKELDKLNSMLVAKKEGEDNARSNA